MKFLKIAILILGLFCFGCSSTSSPGGNLTSESSVNSKKDRDEIQNLIRRVLNWSDSKNAIDLLPAVADSTDSLYVGFDMEEHRLNLEKLKKTDLFAPEFIENYNQIILTLDKKLRAKEFESWPMGELPTFFFANDENPWCLCQDVPYDELNPWDLVEVEVISLNSEKGELNWKWGKPELNGSPGWKEFRYRFKVVKENNKWKIAYLQGFDFKESTRRDG